MSCWSCWRQKVAKDKSKLGNLSSIGTALSGGFTPAALDAPLSVPLSALVESSQQLRIDVNDVEELAASMLAVGLVQPISVTADGKGGYMVVAGHRRVAAARMLGWESIAAHSVAYADDGELSIKGLVENIQRSDLSSLELALAVDRAMAVADMKPSEFARAIGKDAAWLSKVRAVLTLPQEVLDTLALSMSPAERRRLGVEALAELSRVDDEELCISLFGRLRSGELTREGMREAIRVAREPKVYETVVSLPTMPTVTVADLPTSYTLDEILDSDPLGLLDEVETIVPISEVIAAPTQVLEYDGKDWTDVTPHTEPQRGKIGDFWTLEGDRQGVSLKIDFSAFSDAQHDAFRDQLLELLGEWEETKTEAKA